MREGRGNHPGREVQPALFTRFAMKTGPHPVPVLLLMAVLLLVGGYGASKSQVDNSLPVWQSPDAPEWLAYQQFQDRSGIVDPLIVFIPAAIDAADIAKISTSFKELSSVNTCRGVQIDSMQGKRNTLFNLTPITGASPAQLEEILVHVPRILQQYRIEKYSLGGVWYLTNQLDSLSAKATGILFPVVLLVVSIVVLLLCPSAFLLVLSCGLIPAVLLVGIMGMCGVKMNMVLLALPPSITTWEK